MSIEFVVGHKTNNGKNFTTDANMSINLLDNSVGTDILSGKPSASFGVSLYGKRAVKVTQAGPSLSDKYLNYSGTTLNRVTFEHSSDSVDQFNINLYSNDKFDHKVGVKRVQSATYRIKVGGK